MAKTFLVQGGNRGVGLALVRHLRARGDEVYATCREPADAASLIDAVGRCHVLRLDLVDEDSIGDAIQQVNTATDRLHGVFCVAGLLHDGELQPEKRVTHLNADAMHRVFAVNTFGPALVAKHVHPLLRHDEPAFFATLSARVGSIGDNRLGGWYSYRASKAAQNQMMKTFAIEMARRAPHLVVAALHPGTVKTGLSEPFRRGVPEGKLFSPERAARQLIEVVEALTPEQSGAFRAWDGTPIPW